MEKGRQQGSDFGSVFKVEPTAFGEGSDMGLERNGGISVVPEMLKFFSDASHLKCL